MNRRFIGGLLGASLALAQAPEDFAYGLELTLPPGHSLYTLAIPEEVYRHLQSPLFDDLAVFNSQNQAVPYQLFEPRPYVKQPQPVSLTRLPSRPGDQTAPGYLVSLYIQSGELNFEWANPNPAGAVVTIWVSDDLTTWTRKGKLELIDPELVGPTLPAQEFRSPLDLYRFPETYLWLEAPSDQLPELTGAYITYRGSSSELLWVKSGPGEAITDGVRFDLGGFFPVLLFRIGFYQPPGQVSGRLFVDESWDHVGFEIQFSHLIEAGQDVMSAPKSLAYLTDSGRPFPARAWPPVALPARAWRLQAEGARAENLFLEVGYTPHELMFLAEGEGPFILAYGSGQAHTKPTQLMPGLPAWATPAQLSSAPKVLGGTSRLPSDSPPSPWFQVGIYAVLLLVAVILAWLAFRLLGSAPET